MIGLLELLKMSGIEVILNNLKVHLACDDGKVNPKNLFLADILKFKEWQESQGKRNFECKQILALIDIGRETWLFAGIYNVLGCKKIGKLYVYSTELSPSQDELIGRVIVNHKRSRASYIRYKPEYLFRIAEILRARLTIEDFPGFNSVLIDHSKLKTIIEQKVHSWRGALANTKGVYLITDKSTGKLYVGKASGDDGIWQRWSDYVKNGHGGNVNLIELLQEKGPDHKYNFQYSILEAYTAASNDFILKRESHWMNVLISRNEGLNATRSKKKLVTK